MKLASRATWAAARRQVEGVLSDAGIESPTAEARWLTESASGYESDAWIDVASRQVPDRARAHLESMVARRVAGAPLQYVLAGWQFRHLDLFVDERVLIPRPETELVVDVAIAEAERQGIARRRSRLGGPPGRPHVLVDLGTGSGAIALSLATELAGVEVVATDVSPGALEVARLNVAGSAVMHVELRTGSWFDALPDRLLGRCALVVSNPPYVSAAEHAALAPEVRDHEPIEALVPGPTGSEALEVIVDAAMEWLRPGGAVVLELAPAHAEAVAARGRDRGFDDVRIVDDRSGRPRVLVARRP